VVNQRDLLSDPVGLQELEGGSALRVKGSNLAVDDGILGGQQFQGIDNLGLIHSETESQIGVRMPIRVTGQNKQNKVSEE
jgi:hypothetical protein